MINFKTRLAACVFLLGLWGAAACAAEQKGAAPRGGATNAPPAQREGTAEAQAPGQKPARVREGAMRVLAEGSYGGAGPFIAVAREPKVYAALRGMAPSLPELDADFFRSNAVAAVFIGQRNTGGYAVEIGHEGGGRLVVSESAPPPDAITTQAITHPFKVVSVPVGRGEGVSFELQGGLAAALLRPYRVAAGELKTGVPHGGGPLRLEGALGLARQGALATVLFDLKGSGGRGVLRSAATGFIEADGRFSVGDVNSGTLGGGAAVPLRVTASLTADGDRLRLAFESPAGGSGVAGKLEAVAAGPAPGRGRPDASMF